MIHEYVHLHLALGPLANILSAVPGVPIFFVISGYLVSQSYERSSTSAYFLKRARRIYPALWACLAFSIGIAAACGVTFPARTWAWIAAQASIAQFYNPDFLRHFGVGVLNGSLWTIPVELQFYIVLPLLYRLLRTNTALLAAIAVGILVNRLYVHWAWVDDTFAKKLIGVTLAPWLYM